MKKIFLLLAASLSSLTLTAFADCENCDKGCEKKCEEKLAEHFAKADADGDGKITLIELTAMKAAMKAECENKDAVKKEGVAPAPKAGKT